MGCTSSILFFTLKTTGVLRVSEQTEHSGMDPSKHGGSAYTVRFLVPHGGGMPAAAVGTIAQRRDKISSRNGMSARSGPPEVAVAAERPDAPASPGK